jgi:hypothetical protein
MSANLTRFISSRFKVWVHTTVPWNDRWGRRRANLGFGRDPKELEFEALGDTTVSALEALMELATDPRLAVLMIEADEEETLLNHHRDTLADNSTEIAALNSALDEARAA